jgi:hypothetical protein
MYYSVIRRFFFSSEKELWGSSFFLQKRYINQEYSNSHSSQSCSDVNEFLLCRHTYSTLKNKISRIEIRDTNKTLLNDDNNFNF